MQRKLISLVLFCLLIVFTANQVEARPSYKQGFAHNAAESAHPELWRDVVLASVPSLGNTGKLFDQSAFKNHEVSRVGVTWEVGEKGWNINCDGVSGSRVEIADTSELEIPGNELTVAVCVNLTSRTIFDYFISKGNTAYAFGLSSPSFKAGFTIYDGSYHTTESLTPVPANEWVVLHGTFSSNVNIKIYINGVDDSDTNATATGINASSQNVALMGKVGVDTQTADGKMAWAFIWKRVLTPNEILKHATNPLAMFELRPLVYKAPSAGVPTLIQQVIIY